MRVALFGHPLLFFVLCLSICPRPVPGQFPVSSRPALGQLPARRQPFLVELATLPHRPWAPKPSEPLISGFSSTKTPFLCAFCPSEPPFSGISSTKSRFLCAFALRNPHFQAFRAQNRHFCALLGSETPVFRHFEHKIGLFVLGGLGKWHRES